jgi:hypothetical protein
VRHPDSIGPASFSNIAIEYGSCPVEEAAHQMLKNALRQIGRDNFNPPPRQRSEFLDAHRDRIGLLPGGGSRTPDPQGAAFGPRLHKLRQHRLPQMIERNLVAEEKRLVGGHRFDHLQGQRLGPAPYFLDQFGDAGEADPSRQRGQSAFDQILLVGGQIQAGSLFQQLAQELIIHWCHERSPENNRTSFGAI